MKSSKPTSEAAIPLEAKEPKCGVRPRKDQKKAGRSHEVKDVPKRRRDDSDSDREDNGKPDEGS